MEKMKLIPFGEFMNFENNLRSLLLFDVLGLDIFASQYLEYSDELRNKIPSVYKKGYDLLKEHKFLIEPNLQYIGGVPLTIQGFKEWPKNKGESLREYVERVSIRKAAIALSLDYDVILPTKEFENEVDMPTKKDKVAILVFNKLPMLTDINIEQLIDFKSDPDSKLKLAALRNWMIDISYTPYKQNEIEQKLEYLLLEYQHHMDRAKLKYNLRSAEFWFTTVPEIVNDLAHLKLGSAAKALFGFAKKELMLMEEERKAPGKELAFVYKAHQEFG